MQARAPAILVAAAVSPLALRRVQRGLQRLLVALEQVKLGARVHVLHVEALDVALPHAHTRTQTASPHRYDSRSMIVGGVHEQRHSAQDEKRREHARHARTS
jgi:hypothetical protein